MIKPILFNGQMVRAILEDRKTNTRRIVKNVPTSNCGTYSFLEIAIDPDVTTEKKNLDYETLSGTYAEFQHSEYEEFSRYVKSLYSVGDILYVRETFNSDWCDHTIYKADGGSARDAGYSKEPKWHPSLHMPKSAARIFLKVASVRVERLQDVDIPDTVKEGCNVDCAECLATYGDSGTQCCAGAEDECCMYDGSISDFSRLWDSTIPKEKLNINGWDANPYVFVYEFERCEKPEGF